MKTKRTTPRQFLKNISILCFVLVCSLAINTVNAQSKEHTVTGVVSSTDGLLPQATVMLKGTNIGVATDFDGSFTFPRKLKANDVLVVSYLGYKDREITIKEGTSFVKPFLDDIPLVIVADLRTKPARIREK